MKQYSVSFDDYTNSLVEQMAGQAQMSVPDFLRYTTLLYLTKQQKEPDGAQTSDLPADPAADKTAAVRPRKMVLPEQNDMIFSRFVGFFNEKLRSCRQPYIWNYQICPESRVDWADPNLYTGSSADDSHALHRLCGEKLAEAMASGNETLCFEAVRLAMDWGKTYYNHRFGVLKGNEEIVCALHERGELLDVIRRSSQAIQDGRISDLEYFTTGWSIIWHVLNAEHMIIMGTREMYAYNRILSEFRQLDGNGILPASLELGQLVYKKNRRYVAGVPYVYTLKGKLRMLERLLRITEAVKAMGDAGSMVEIDEKLFMLGEYKS